MSTATMERLRKELTDALTPAPDAHPAPRTAGPHPTTTWGRPSHATPPWPLDVNNKVKDQA